MLIAKIFINEEQIDEIHIQNVGEVKPGEYGLHRYKIRKPELPEDIVLIHKRSVGYEPLLQKALHYIKQFT